MFKKRLPCPTSASHSVYDLTTKNTQVCHLVLSINNERDHKCKAFFMALYDFAKIVCEAKYDRACVPMNAVQKFILMQ